MSMRITFAPTDAAMLPPRRNRVSEFIMVGTGTLLLFTLAISVIVKLYSYSNVETTNANPFAPRQDATAKMERLEEKADDITSRVNELKLQQSQTGIKQSDEEIRLALMESDLKLIKDDLREQSQTIRSIWLMMFGSALALLTWGVKRWIDHNRQQQMHTSRR